MTVLTGPGDLEYLSQLLVVLGLREKEIGV